jgi:hypothetical protein
MVEFLESNCLKLVVIAGVLSVVAFLVSGDGRSRNRIEEDLTREHRQRAPIAEPMAGRARGWDEQSRWR